MSEINLKRQSMHIIIKSWKLCDTALSETGKRKTVTQVGVCIKGLPEKYSNSRQRRTYRFVPCQ